MASWHDPHDPRRERRVRRVVSMQRDEFDDAWRVYCERKAARRWWLELWRRFRG